MLQEELSELSKTPYFDAAIDDFLNNLLVIIGLFIQNYEKIPKPVSRRIAKEIWSASKFLTGSITKVIPYEVVYALRLALNDWCKEPFAITTALLEDQEYYIQLVKPAEIIKQYVQGIDFKTELIQIALPKLYRHRPLYNVALYHELGHFIDNHLSITNTTFFTNPKFICDGNQAKEIYHRMEIFADLFAASYTGTAISRFLKDLIPNATDSLTHPATNLRLNTIEAFLNNDKNNIFIDMFSEALAIRKLPTLTVRFIKPDITNCYNNIRPYDIRNIAELHGILASAWDYLDIIRQKQNLWGNIDEYEAERIVNDITEKSIRNDMILRKWTDATTDTK